MQMMQIPHPQLPRHAPHEPIREQLRISLCMRIWSVAFRWSVDYCLIIALTTHDNFMRPSRSNAFFRSLTASQLQKGNTQRLIEQPLILISSKSSFFFINRRIIRYYEQHPHMNGKFRTSTDSPWFVFNDGTINLPLESYHLAKQK